MGVIIVGYKGTTIIICLCWPAVLGRLGSVGGVCRNCWNPKPMLEELSLFDFPLLG